MLFLKIWVCVVILGLVLVSLLGAILGEIGLWLFLTLLVAALFTGIAVFADETEALRRRVEALETAAGITSVPEKAGAVPERPAEKQPPLAVTPDEM